MALEGGYYKFYLPMEDTNLTYLNRYIATEFPPGKSTVYSVPATFSKQGEKQAVLAEQLIYNSLHGLSQSNLSELWLTFFFNTSYAGLSKRKLQTPKLISREHDFIVFAKFKDKKYLALIEVKSTKDSTVTGSDLQKTSDSKEIKNNKRSAQHQLRDHMEVLEELFGKEVIQNVQTFIMWPFLGPYTEDPKQNRIRRWQDDHNLHVFENDLSDQASFNNWFERVFLQGPSLEESSFFSLFKRFVVLSSGVDVREISEGLTALLTQEQLDLLSSNQPKDEKTAPLVIYGAAGTGKTMLVLRRLEQLHQNQQLDEHNKALFICFWPGIRSDFQQRVQLLGFGKFVDTVRFYVSRNEFKIKQTSNYKHIFMDEAEIMCLSFEREVFENTLSSIYSTYHRSNCTVKDCSGFDYQTDKGFKRIYQDHKTSYWGDLWFMVDSNQAQMFLPKFAPCVLKNPSTILNKVLRSAKTIFNVFKRFYENPGMPAGIGSVPKIEIGHHIEGPPVYWVEICKDPAVDVVNVIVDLTGSKGIQPCDICILPFSCENLAPDKIDKLICERYVEKGFRPVVLGNVEQFVESKQVNNILFAWPLRVKGLEFKVVILVFDNEDFDVNDVEDRKRAYLIISRCTSLLVLISSSRIRQKILGKSKSTFIKFPFDSSWN